MAIRRQKTLYVTGTVLLLGLIYAFWLRPLSPQQALPEELRSGYVEYYWAAGFLPDFIYCLRVEASMEQFHHYADRLELELGTELQGMPSCLGRTAEDGTEVTWWNPPSIDGSAFVYQKPESAPDYAELLLYGNGNLYFIAWVH